MEYEIIDQWGTPNIYVSLIIFIIVRVCGAGFLHFLTVGAWSSNIPIVVGAWSSNILLVVGATCVCFQTCVCFHCTLSLSQFVFAAISVSLPIPSGVFFPVFVIGKTNYLLGHMSHFNISLGGAFGRLIGEAMAVWFPSGFSNVENLISGGYAVVGESSVWPCDYHVIFT